MVAYIRRSDSYRYTVCATGEVPQDVLKNDPDDWSTVTVTSVQFSVVTGFVHVT